MNRAASMSSVIFTYLFANNRLTLFTINYFKITTQKWRCCSLRLLMHIRLVNEDGIQCFRKLWVPQAGTCVLIMSLLQGYQCEHYNRPCAEHALTVNIHDLQENTMTMPCLTQTLRLITMYVCTLTLNALIVFNVNTAFATVMNLSCPSTVVYHKY